MRSATTRSPVITGASTPFGMMTKEFELSAGDITVELVDVYSTDTRTVAVEHLVAHRNGKTFDQTFPIVFNGRGGKAREVWAFHFGDNNERECRMKSLRESARRCAGADLADDLNV